MSWKSWSYFKGIMEPLLVFVETSAPVSGLIMVLLSNLVTKRRKAL